MKKINAVYFSPTKTTKTTTVTIAETIGILLNSGKTIEDMDITKPLARTKSMAFGENDIVILGVPVYAGRVPNVILKFLKSIEGNGAIGVPVVVYGNRSYDDALVELKDIMEMNGFVLASAGAFIGEHSFSYKLGRGRPNADDLLLMKILSSKTVDIIKDIDMNGRLEVRGNKKYRDYYRPRDVNGELYDFRIIKPVTHEVCIDCKICADQCPMGSIEHDDVSQVSGICIKCGSCIKNCPVEAKVFEDKNYIKHKIELEEEFGSAKEPEFFFRTCSN